MLDKVIEWYKMGDINQIRSKLTENKAV